MEKEGDNLLIGHKNTPRDTKSLSYDNYRMSKCNERFWLLNSITESEIPCGRPTCGKGNLKVVVAPHFLTSLFIVQL